MLNIFRRSPAEDLKALDWTGVVPPIDTNVESLQAQEIASLLPLETGHLWIDFLKVDNNDKYTLWVTALWDDGTIRKVRRADISFLKDRPGWPASVHVNGTEQRFDGVMDVSFSLYPFERRVTIIQTQGRQSSLRVALLTGVQQAGSLDA